MTKIDHEIDSCKTCIPILDHLRNSKRELQLKDFISYFNKIKDKSTRNTIKYHLNILLSGKRIETMKHGRITKYLLADLDIQIRKTYNEFKSFLKNKIDNGETSFLPYLEDKLFGKYNNQEDHFIETSFYNFVSSLENESIKEGVLQSMLSFAKYEINKDLTAKRVGTQIRDSIYIRILLGDKRCFGCGNKFKNNEIIKTVIRYELHDYNTFQDNQDINNIVDYLRIHNGPEYPEVNQLVHYKQDILNVIYSLRETEFSQIKISDSRNELNNAELEPIFKILKTEFDELRDIKNIDDLLTPLYPKKPYNLNQFSSKLLGKYHTKCLPEFHQDPLPKGSNQQIKSIIKILNDKQKKLLKNYFNNALIRENDLIVESKICEFCSLPLDLNLLNEVEGIADILDNMDQKSKYLYSVSNKVILIDIKSNILRKIDQYMSTNDLIDFFGEKDDRMLVNISDFLIGKRIKFISTINSIYKNNHSVHYSCKQYVDWEDE